METVKKSLISLRCLTEHYVTSHMKFVVTYQDHIYYYVYWRIKSRSNPSES
jgi:hypothetical protein